MKCLISTRCVKNWGKVKCFSVIQLGCGLAGIVNAMDSDKDTYKNCNYGLIGTSMITGTYFSHINR